MAEYTFEIRVGASMEVTVEADSLEEATAKAELEGAPVVCMGNGSCGGTIGVEGYSGGDFTYSFGDCWIDSRDLSSGPEESSS